MGSYANLNKSILHNYVMNDSRYRDALNYLYSLTNSGIKLGLENTSKLLQYFGNPHPVSYTHLTLPTILLV